MKNYFLLDEWNIIEDGFHPKENKLYESVMSLGNGNMGIRGNFEEDYSGDSLRGTYIAGIYYPDKTRVGWWKNGYPEYFAKVINAVNFIGIKVVLNSINLDLSKWKVKDFKRVLHMNDGYLERSFIAIDEKGNETKIETKRFLSTVRNEIAAIRYCITPLNYDGELEITPYLDGDVSNEDSNYDEKFWLEVDRSSNDYSCDMTMKTKKLNFCVTAAMKYDIYENGAKIITPVEIINNEKFVGNNIKLNTKKNVTITLNKYIAITNNRYYAIDDLKSKAENAVDKAFYKGFDALLEENAEKWHKRWSESDIVIKGDVKAQQSIRFNIFKLNETYTGEDMRLNVGPKGFTGEKYGGSTYWDTEAYCIPFFLSTADEKISKNLLIYRYNQLGRAIENGKKLGFKDGAALYPMVTMNGEECHNEWEITFEEIHRNAAIAYAIYDYVNYTGDKSYIGKYGIYVLTAISRFWSQRVNFSKAKGKYVILGVTGPNEYENNVNNNWYTNKMACWTMEYTIKAINYLKEKCHDTYDKVKVELKLNESELNHWQEIIDNMYFPYNDKDDVFMQQDGYMDKEQIMACDINKDELPINQHWSWDRILRSCFIKQADVLQGLYFLEDRYDVDTIKRNFDFYEPRTVHESSLSPCIHSIIAAKIGEYKKAYNLYLRTARLDLDNYNNDTYDGLHITSMAGTWMSIVYGFGGMRVNSGFICFNPFIPDAWNEYSFKVLFRKHLLNVSIDKENIKISLEKGECFDLKIYGNVYRIENELKVPVKKA